MTGERVLVGRIVKPHGIRGELSVHVLSDVEGRFDAGVVLDGAGRPLTVASTRPHQDRLLVRFEEVPDRDAAEILRGVELYAEPVDLTGSETYFVQELVGMLVVAPDGTGLGRVSDLIELPAAAGYDLLEVQRADGSTWLLPATDDLVEVVADDAGDEMLALIDPPEGLVDPAGAVGGPTEDPT